MHENYLLRPPLYFLLKLCFRVEVRGVENYHAAGDKCLIICNHQSYLDPMIIGVFLPEKPAFAINIYQADKWYFKWLDKLAKLYKLDPSRPMVMKKLIQDLRKGCKVALFPEGRITTSGGIMKVYDGTGKILEKTGAAILPIRIDGAEYSKVSRMGGRLRRRMFPKITLTILPPHKPVEEGNETHDSLVYDMMSEAAFLASNYRTSILSAIVDAHYREGPKHIIASDANRIDMNYKTLFTRAFVLRDALQPKLEGQGYVGVLLPNALAVAVTFVSLHMLGKVPCMLNYSAGEANILHGCKIAAVKTVLTSRLFIERAKLEPVIEALQKEYTVIYLEDVRDGIGLADKLKGAYNARFCRDALDSVLKAVKPDDPAVILYTSGSEGVPKGVALSHSNLLANINQCIARLDLLPSDTVFNALPVFHSFGLAIGMLMPLVRGIKTMLYPSPLHYRMIPDLVYDTDSTIMLGTDTFFRGYAHYAHPYDFWRIRLAVAGAEKLKDSTRRLYADKFGMTIHEGYGVTETSPVLSVNTPMQHKAGTVGRPLPKVEYKLEPVEGLTTGGRLLVKGPNVMLGYLKADAPGVIQPQGEWYDTGDIVSVDDQHYITIQGRAKRFAKIAGEMVSLMMVEDIAATLYAEAGHAAIAAADEKKGEHIVLFTEQQDMTREQLIQYVSDKGLPELCLPKHLVFRAEIPRLGNGKIDYMTLQKEWKPN
jgi:acyl-[acyl-carrier-protein]-phospholipid O-acyltransferase/long-chain-fatty-acid--[acyl-carrier-protein] ligase